MKRILFALLFAAGCASTQTAAAPVTADPVIAAERAFAADGAQRGWIAAFRSYAAAEAMTLSPGPVNAQENLAQQRGDGSTNLAWGPAYAGVARSGDFGFTTGPFWLRDSNLVLGHYFTVWRKQPDGTWKWIFDGGTNVTATEVAAATGPIPTLPISTSANTRTQAAVNDVRRIEGLIDADASGHGEVLARYIASDAHVNRPGAAPAIGRDAGLPLIQASQGLGYEAPVMLEAATSGDMAFTLGSMRWTDAGVEKRGYYARIWQRRGQTWLIVFDEIVPHRG